MPVVNVWGSLGSTTRAAHPEPPEPHDIWPLTTGAGGTAWVYYSPMSRNRLVRPVVLADGFAMGRSSLAEMWAGLEENGRYRFISALHAIGRDVVILGFDDRRASMLDNARTAMECLCEALAERVGDAKLVVGGFGTGGLVMRYALAKMQRDPAMPDPETALYMSYDTPHNGAWMPVSLQAFAHFVKDNWGMHNPLFAQFSELINCPAARQMTRWHIGKIGDRADQSIERLNFLDELAAVGEWPRDMRRIGVANGVRTGVGNGIDPDTMAVRGCGEVMAEACLYTQDMGEQVVTTLHAADQPAVDVYTGGLPDIDGAPGSMFPETPTAPGSFGLAAMLMQMLGCEQIERRYGTSCFVPTVSAVAAGPIDSADVLYGEIRQRDSELDAFACASENEGHTAMTKELGAWLVEEIEANS